MHIQKIQTTMQDSFKWFVFFSYKILRIFFILIFICFRKKQTENVAPTINRAHLSASSLFFSSLVREINWVKFERKLAFFDQTACAEFIIVKNFTHSHRLLE